MCPKSRNTKFQAEENQQQHCMVKSRPTSTQIDDPAGRPTREAADRELLKTDAQNRINSELLSQMVTKDAQIKVLPLTLYSETIRLT